MIDLSIGNGVVTVEYDGRRADESGGYRRQYLYTVTVPDAGWQYVGNDLHSGVGAEVDERGTLGVFLSFLSACVESRQYGGGGENTDLFPDYVGAWAETYADDIAMAAWDFDPDSPLNN
jgi:hypothetical protein